MIDDPIVNEVRAAREAYAAQFNYDIHAICEDLRRRTEEARKQGRTVLAAPPPPSPTPQPAPIPKAG